MGFVLVAVIAAAIWLTPSPPQSKVVLLPGDDGKVGALVVKSTGNEVLLDTAYAGATVDAKDNAVAQAQKADETRAAYAQVLAAMPPKPRSFVIYFEYGPKGGIRRRRRPGAEGAARLRGHAAAPEITVIGHTDTMGPSESNDVLSIKRATAVRDFLLDEGIKAARMEVSGRGERELAVPTADEVPEPKESAGGNQRPLGSPIHSPSPSPAPPGGRGEP